MSNSPLVHSFYLFTIPTVFTLSIFSCSIVAETDAFSPAMATWYGDSAGAGSGNVMCKEKSACSEIPIKVTITDECPGSCGNYGAPFHFNLSGTAFWALAKPGQADLLRGDGILNIGYKRVACNYPQTTVIFKMDQGSNPSYFSCVIEFENGGGDLGLVELQSSTGLDNKWLAMQQSWGANWKIELPPQMKPPFSIRLTTLDSNKTLVASNVIPLNWAPGQIYHSLVNF
ncbi:hypothetical protein RDI58_024248 [Solanum bulbocastanum]|uniref:Uncharacterized protein n=1 Tax=Solanum bulbocastanum TaxID=147425 RepID=A0AAN8T5H3_SOLBU